LGVDEGTAVIVQGRTLHCMGDSTVTVCLAATNGHPAKEVVLESGDVSDLTMYRRAARDRTLAPFPPEKVAEADVPRGALVIVGGGGMPDRVIEKFIQLAGGPHAPIVVVPTRKPAPRPRRPP